MTLTDFNDGWTVAGQAHADPIPVTLPHDAMIHESRDAESGTGSHGGYYPGGRYVYSKQWTPPSTSEDTRYSLVFEGVYGLAEVRLDGRPAMTATSGYREFQVPMGTVEAGRPVLIEVDVDNTAVPNSRWYTGSGIYRKVWLEEVGEARITRDGVRTRTRLHDGIATLSIDVVLEGGIAGRHVVKATLAAPDGLAVTASTEVLDERAEIEFAVADAALWSAELPNLHLLTVELVDGDAVVDAKELRVGLRTVEVDAARGLRINETQVLLRGACVHHDNGVLGAATFRAAEYRRARILKDAGFNAVRSSHNPLSRDFIDACDEVGLYVLDELTDVWFGPKTAHDQSAQFDQTWRDDAWSMVAKDRNHASVIMYSIGNEIAESGSERGIATAKEINTFIAELDPERPTTLAVNFMLNVMADMGQSPFDTSEHGAEGADRKKPTATSTVANVLANRIGSMMQAVSKLPKADKVSRGVFAAVEVAGYNYAWGRYKGDAKRHPTRVVLGTESMPGDIVRIWPIVEATPNVIGDFVWTGWDYLGESGIGTWTYGADAVGIGKPYPELIAGCGLIDITGHPGAALLLSPAAWNQLKAPQIAVHPLDHAGEKTHRVAWRSTDALQSWAWKGSNGRPAIIDVYSNDEQVELLLNGKSLGRKAVPKRRGTVVQFRTPYEEGEIVAVGYRDGREVSRSSLSSAATTRVHLAPESPQVDADPQELAFVWITIADDDGVVEMIDDDEIEVSVTGPAVLAGLGSAAPATTASFVDERHTTWRGRALAVLRSTGEAGTVTVTVTSKRHGSATAEVTARALAASAATAS